MKKCCFKRKVSIVVLVLVSAASVGCQKGSELNRERSVMNHVEKEEDTAHEEKKVNFALVSPNHAIAVGKSNKVTLEILPRNGLKINHDFPWKVKFKSQNNLIVDEKELTKDQIDMTDKRVKMTIDVTPGDAGTFSLEGVGTFSVCSLKLCDIRRDEPLHFTLVAEPEA